MFSQTTDEDEAFTFDCEMKTYSLDESYEITEFILNNTKRDSIPEDGSLLGVGVYSISYEHKTDRTRGDKEFIILDLDSIEVNNTSCLKDGIQYRIDIPGIDESLWEPDLLKWTLDLSENEEYLRFPDINDQFRLKAPKDFVVRFTILNKDIACDSLTFEKEVEGKKNFDDFESLEDVELKIDSENNRECSDKIILDLEPGSLVIGVDFTLGEEISESSAGVYEIHKENQTTAFSYTKRLVDRDKCELIEVLTIRQTLLDSIQPMNTIDVDTNVVIKEPSCGSTDGSIEIVGINLFQNTILLDGDPIEDNLMIDGLSSGNYELSIRNKAGCASDPISIVLQPDDIEDDIGIVELYESEKFVIFYIPDSLNATDISWYRLDKNIPLAKPEFIEESAGKMSIIVECENGLESYKDNSSLRHIASFKLPNQDCPSFFFHEEFCDLFSIRNEMSCEPGFIAASPRSNQLSVLPNPAVKGSSIIIKNEGTVFNASLYDLTGQLVSSKINNDHSNSLLMSSTGLSPGIYIISVELENNVFVNQKIMIHQ